jgi:ferrous iron transport protein B
MERERGLDRSAAMADMRYSFIYKVCDRCIRRPRESKEHIRSSRYDNVLTGKYTAIPVFIAVMAAVFFLTFAVIGPFLQGLLEKGIGSLAASVGDAMTAGNVNHAISSLVMDGIFEGVGSVLSFLPIIVTMYFFLSLLEDSGYIARVAFVMDKILRRLGLSGRSIVPMLIGFGCTVPAVMSTRTLPSERDRRMTILLTPFMSCTAKLPIYAFFVDAFFEEYKALIMIGLYTFGILMAVLVALIYKKTLFRGEAVPFVMEMPNYRLPSARNVAQLLWEKSKDFLSRAFSVILIATVIVWFLKTFDFSFNIVTDSHDSILAVISGVLVPLFRPAGLGDWRIITSLVSGFMAKESVVSVLGVLFGGEGGVTAMMTPLTAASLLVFSLLYTPCVAAVASVKSEMGGRWAVYVVLWQCFVAWTAAVVVRVIGLMLGLA